MSLELTVVFSTAVYVPPSANVKDAMRKLYSAITDLQLAHPDAFKIKRGDFNQANLKSVLPKFSQRVECATGSKNTFDKVYTNIKYACKEIPHAHIGVSDHLTVMLMPTYEQRVKLEHPVTKEIRIWSRGAMETFQGSFDCTLCFFLKSVTGYLTKCLDNVTIKRQ